jgi:hypothetical protein
LAQPVKVAWPTWAFRPARPKQGSSPHSPPARGSLAESGRPAASGRGRRCPGGEGPDSGHRRWRGSPWGSHGGEEGRRWGTGDGRPKKRWRVPAQGSWSDGELGRRSLR